VIGCVSLGSFDPEAMEEAIQKSQFEHSLDSPGQFRGTILQAKNARTRLDWGRYSLPVLARGPVPADRMTLGMLLNEREDSLFNGNILSPGSIMLYGEGEELNVRLPPNSNWLSIQLDRRSLAEIGIEFSDCGFRCWDAALRNAVRRQILNDAEVLVSSSDQPHPADKRAANQAINDVEDCVLHTLANLVTAKRAFSSQSSTRSRDRTLQIVRDAANYMEANIEFPITISEICSSLDTNIKTLERAFLHTYGLGPKQYLLKKRLSKLRQLLNLGSTREDTLVDAYLSCGLSHFGRAAQNYRAYFGESPSHTLSRARS
jgi:AraC family ethanolamine operon transcriptional activator